MMRYFVAILAVMTISTSAIAGGGFSGPVSSSPGFDSASGARGGMAPGNHGERGGMTPSNPGLADAFGGTPPGLSTAAPSRSTTHADQADPSLPVR